MEQHTSDSTPILRVLPASHRPRCLVTNLHPERGLSRALRQHLSLVVRGVDFTLEDEGPIESIWVCGYEEDQVERVAELRAQHPRAVLLVTGGQIAPGWAGDVVDAGADHAREWPLSYETLGSLLLGGRDVGIEAAAG